MSSSSSRDAGPHQRSGPTPLRLIIALLGAHQRPAADPDDGAADDEDDPGAHDQRVLDGAARLRHQRQDQVPKPEREREPENERDHQRRRGKCRGLSPRVLARRNEQLAADQRWVDAIGQRDRDHSNRELEHRVKSIALRQVQQPLTVCRSITRAGSASSLPFSSRLTAVALLGRSARRPNSRSDRTICPARALDCRREAVLTTSPRAVKSLTSPAPTLPT